MEKYYIYTNRYSTISRVLASGKTVYDVSFRIVTYDGLTKQKRICGFQTKKEAQRAYTDFVTSHCTLISQPVRAKTENVAAHDYTVSEIVQPFVNHLSLTAKASTVYDWSSIINRFIIPSLGDRKLSSLSSTALYNWQEEIYAAKMDDGSRYSTAYRRKIIGVLNNLLNYSAKRFGTVNNMKSVERPKERTVKTEMHTWTPEQYRAFLDVIDDPMYKALFGILIYTGRRKGEVIALRKSDVKDDRITFAHTYTRKTHDGTPYAITETKNGKVGSTITPNPLRAILALYEPQEPFFFCGDNPIHENTIAHRFKVYTERAGLPPIRIHDLRHTFVTNLISLGASVMLCADMIGDTPDQIMRTYGHLYDADKKRIIDLIN